MITKYTSYILILFSFVVIFNAFYGLEKDGADSVIATIPVGKWSSWGSI